MPSVRLDRLRKQFGKVIAVNDISVEFRDGELTSILGPSGCGKTTTLNVIAGFIEPDGGTVHFGEQLIADSARGIIVPPNKRDLGMVFQSYALWPHLSVADNVAYGLKMRKVSRARREDAVGIRTPTDFPTSFPAASSSVSRWRGRSPTRRRYCCATSRSRTLMPSCARRCGWSSRRSIARSVSRAYMSRMTKQKR
jgi:ABC-type sugar transport system ATPase subunit